MPAEEHVEPVSRHARPRCVRSSPRLRPRPSPPRPPSPEGQFEGRSAAAAAKPSRRLRGAQGGGKHGGQEAKRRAGRRDTQRVPLRLSESLRRRTDRRRRGAAMSGKEQVESSRRTVRRPSAQPAAAQQRLRQAVHRRPAAAEPAAAPAAAAPAPALVLRPMRPREELFVLRSACGGDVRALCGGVPPGGGRIVRMSGDPGRLSFARLQGRPGPVRGAISIALPICRRSTNLRRADGYSPRKARINWINRIDKAK